MRDIAALFREYVRLDRQRGGDGLSPAQLQRWQDLKRLLSQHFSPGDKASRVDRRDSVRVPTRIRVAFRDERELGHSLMTNLSRRGVFVRTRHPSEIGTRFDLSIHVDDPPSEIVVPVEVVSVNMGPHLEPGFRGMGLRFVDPKPEVEKQIEELYERQVR